MSAIGFMERIGLVRRVRENERIPWGFGIYRAEGWTCTWYCTPIPLNLILRLVHASFIWLLRPVRRFDSLYWDDRVRRAGVNVARSILEARDSTNRADLDKRAQLILSTLTDVEAKLEIREPLDVTTVIEAKTRCQLASRLMAFLVADLGAVANATEMRKDEGRRGRTVDPWP